MPQEDFEVIFVDDGSPDDTWDRLKRVRATHGNVRIERIENSGWPSRPRNVALELARGEYVVFMDHDDELPPHALEAAYELGHRNGADAVNGKESLTRFPGWALGIYTENIDNAIGRIAPIPLMPLNPHKMYRRQFLLDHGIRFPEGRRHIWEDIFFNVEVYAHARVISVLSDTAFYHWVTTGENNSASYGADHAEHWGFLDRLLAFIDEQLADERHREARTALLLQQYQRRALSFFFSHVNAKSPDDVDLAAEHLRGYFERYITPEMEQQLPADDAARSYLLRAGKFALARELAAFDRGVVGTTTADSVSWADGRLQVSGTASWAARSEPAPRLRGVDGRVHRDFPSELRDALPVDLIDVSDALALADAQFGVRDEREMSVWLLPTERTMTQAVDEAGMVSVAFHQQLHLDIDDAIFGRALENPVWTFNSRNALLNHLNQRPVLYDGAPAIALVNGRPAIAYAGDDRRLRLDLAERERSVVEEAAGDLAAASTLDGSTVRIALPLSDVQVVGSTRIVGRVNATTLPGRLARAVDRMRIGRAVRRRLRRVVGTRSGAAALIGDGAGARLEFEFERPRPGTYGLEFVFTGRSARAPFVLVVHRAGVELRRPEPSPE